MFEYAFVEAHGRTARPYTFLASVAGQLGVIGLSVLIPMVFVEGHPSSAMAWRQHIPLLLPPGVDRPDRSAGAAERAPTPHSQACRARQRVRAGEVPPQAASSVDPDELRAPAPGAETEDSVPYGLGDPPRRPSSL